MKWIWGAPGGCARALPAPSSLCTNGTDRHVHGADAGAATAADTGAGRRRLRRGLAREQPLEQPLGRGVDDSALPLVKLGYLGIRTLSKPLANMVFLSNPFLLVVASSSVVHV